MGSILIKIIVFFLLSAGITPAFSVENKIENAAFYVDSTNTLSIEDVQKLDFQPYQGFLGKPIRDTALWIRLSAKSDLEKSPLVLRMLPTYLDDIQVYQKINDGWVVKHIGASHAYSDGEKLGIALAVSVINPIENENLYLRIRAKGFSVFNVELVNIADFNYLESLRDLSLGAILGIIAILALLQCFQLSKKHILLQLQLIGLLLTEVIFYFFFFGFSARFVFPESPDLNQYLRLFFAFSYGLFGALFHRSFLVREVPIKVLHYILNGVVLVIITYLCLFIAGYSSISLKISVFVNFLLNIIFISIPIVYLFTKKFQPYIANIYLMLGLVGFGAVAGYFLMADLWISMYLTLLTGVISSLLVIYLFKELRVREMMAMIELEKTIDSLELEVEFEKERIDHRGKFLAMLSHQIRTPLYVLRLVIDGLSFKNQTTNQAHEAIDDVEKILDRSLLSHQFDGHPRNDIKSNIFYPMTVIEKIVLKFQLKDRFVIDGDQDLRMYSDEYLCEVIFVNLIENSVKYSPPDTKIFIKCSSKILEGKSVFIFSIKNNVGKAGFPDPNLVFSKYYRAQGVHGSVGLGLGLFLVKSISEILGGSVGFSRRNDFAIFETSIPSYDGLKL